MNVIIPRPLTLAATNVPAPTEPEWDSVTSWTAGTRVYLASQTPHKVYEALSNNSNKNPATNPTYWVEVGPTSQWAMLDALVTTQTVNTDSITVTVTASKVDRIALLGLSGESVRIVARNGATIISDETVSLRLDNQSTSWSEWFFDDIEYRSDLIRVIPGFYANLEVDITITAATGTDAKCGHVIMGRTRELGLSEWGAKGGIADYSRKEVNDFGETYLLQRPYAKTLEIDLWIDTAPNGAEVDRLYRLLSGLRAVPCIYNANNDTDLESFIAFGFYRDFSVLVEYATVTHCSIEIEGMI